MGKLEMVVFPTTAIMRILKENNISMRTMAKEMGISDKTLSTYLKRYELPVHRKKKLQKKAVNAVLAEEFKEKTFNVETNELWKAIDTIFNRLDFLREVLSKRGVINPFEYDNWDRDLSIRGVDDRDSLRIHVIMPDEQHKYWDEWAKKHHVKIVSEKEKEDA